LFLARESLVSAIPAGDEKTAVYYYVGLDDISPLSLQLTPVSQYLMTTLNSGLLLSFSPWCKYSLVSVGLVSNVVLFILLASGLLPTQESNPEVLLNVSKDTQKATVRQNMTGTFCLLYVNLKPDLHRTLR
jgi:hypothetical protein